MSQALERKTSPIGVADFKDLILGNHYYVDKTQLVAQVWQAGKIVLMPRPRRFGKTLNLSMLRYFFEKSTSDNSVLFADSKLLKDYPEYRELLGRYPVIFLTFKDVGKDSWAGTCRNFDIMIQEEFGRHSYLYKTIVDSRSKKLFKKIWDGDATREEFAFSLKFLSRLLCEYHREKAILILDEYDAPLHKGLGFHECRAYCMAFYRKEVLIKMEYLK